MWPIINLYEHDMIKLQRSWTNVDSMWDIIKNSFNVFANCFGIIALAMIDNLDCAYLFR